MRFSALIRVARSMKNAILESSHLTFGRVASVSQAYTCTPLDNVNKSRSCTAQPAAMARSLYWDADDDYYFEDIHQYTTGGFHPIHLGDVLSSSIKCCTSCLLNSMAGWDSPRTIVSLSVCHLSTILYYIFTVTNMSLSRSVLANADPKHELEIFNQLSRMPPMPLNVLQLRDHFSLQGPNSVHTVLVSNICGNLLSIVGSPNGPRRNHVQKLCHEITVGLAALHRQGIVHGGMMCHFAPVPVPPTNMAR